MLIAHLPAGYILAKTLFTKYRPTLISKKTFFIAILCGAIFPDLDLFYFYFIDGRAVHHHYYFFHWPLLYILIGLISYAFYKLAHGDRLRRYGFIVCLFSLAVLLHISLDTFVGDVWLFMPFINQSYALFEVLDVQSHWMLNFILHWSFLVEIMICVYALRLYLNDELKF